MSQDDRSNDEPAAGRRVSLANLGAWLLKCNPRVTDLHALIDHGVETWCVQDNYRSALCAPDQSVILWVSGSTGATPTPGIWATGHLTGPATWRAPADDLPPKYVVPLALHFLRTPLSRQAIAAHPDLSDLEVIRQPHMSNPSFITQKQLHALTLLLETG